MPKTENRIIEKAPQRRWFSAKESKRLRNAHLAGHAKLGDGFTKCGKTLGADVTNQALRGFVDLCKSCRHEDIRELARRKAIVDACVIEAPKEYGHVLHELKIWPNFFAAILKGTKRFEVRRNDRGFKVKDMLHLREWDPATLEYTGSDMRVRVTYVMHDTTMLQPGYIAMGITRI